jgi:hypothetical protein
LLIAGFMLAGGCARDVRLSGKKLREVQVKPVSHFGLTLDEKATPVQVAFAALQAIKADAGAKTEAEREAALDIQFDLAAANEISAREQDGLERQELLYTVVHHWTPTVLYYVQDFPVTLDEAGQRIVERSVSDDEAELAMVVNAPGAAPSAQVVMLIWLAKDKGLWRVLHFGFDGRVRSVGPAKPKPAPESAGADDAKPDSR